MPVNIFFCFVQEDEALLNQLKVYLGPLEQSGLIRFWYDRRIGKEEDRWSSSHLNAAHIVLMLVSDDFLNSDYCDCLEMKRALMQKGSRVIPIILHPVHKRLGPLAELRPLPTNGRSVKGPDWHTIDDAFKNIAEGIRKVAEELKFVPFPVERLSTLHTLNHDNPVTDLAVSADGYIFVSGSQDGLIKIWNRLANKPIYTLTNHTSTIHRVAISLDGQTLVSGSADCTIRVMGSLPRETNTSSQRPYRPC